MERFTQVLKATVLLLVLAAPSLLAQGFVLPDTLRVKVTFYDFHPNGATSLNGFEQCNTGLKPGMIQNYLSADRKPVFKAALACNDSMAGWFRPYKYTGSNQFVYDSAHDSWSWSNLNASGTYPGFWVTSGWADYVAPKTNAMTNLVYYDSLPFLLQDSATGTYSFTRSGNNGFFWLDNKGFGNEPASANPRHNFSFTMELHHQFTYKGGEYFQFSGDDDVWVFINNTLVIDLGGVHSSANGQVRLDSVASSLGLRIGRKYWFDFFYCERHTTQANCVITTNILTPTKPNKILITLTPTPPDPAHPDTASNMCLQAGQCVTFHTWVVDDTGGVRPDWDTLVHWSVRDTLGNIINLKAVADSNRFCPTKAQGGITIYVSFTDPNFPTITLTDSIKVCTTPSSAHHLLIEGDTATSPRNNNPLDSVTLASTQSKDTVYAVIRDAYGNRVKLDTSAQWTVLDGATIISVATTGTHGAVGWITKLGPPGRAHIIARSISYGGALFSDTLTVIVSPISYNQLRIATGEGGQRRAIDSLSVQFTRDTLLYVEGFRSDGLGWEAVNAGWGLIGLADPVPPAQARPTSGPSWRYQPPDTGHGRMYVSYGALRDTIRVTVQPGGPASVVLYPASGPPGPPDNIVYNPPTTVYNSRAGSPTPFTAKIFDPYGSWLSNYETDPTKAALFTWEVRDATTGNLIAPTVGTLSSATGPSVSFVPYETNATVNVIVTFQQGLNLYRDTVRVRVQHGLALHMSLEASPDSTLSPHADNPIAEPVTIQTSDTTSSLYAILRDQYGNFARYATTASWVSRDTSVVQVSAGPQVALGQGTLRRAATALSETYVVATDQSYIDSVRVVVEPVSYTHIRLVVNAGGLRPIDTLRMGTDVDTTLYAQGQRLDNGQWVYVPVTWQAPGLSTTPNPPGTQVSLWTFRPSTIASGRIIIVKGSNRDTVWAIFTHGKPLNLALYTDTATAAATYPLPPTLDTLTAGDSAVIVTRLVDHRGVRLTEYETSSAPITWSRTELSGNPPTGNLSASTGYRTVFRPTRAYNTVEILATFSENGIVLTRAVRFYIKPSVVNHLTVEASPDRAVSPNADNRLAALTIASNQTVGYAYAILRDAFGNWVQPANPATWTSRVPATVACSVGVAVNGEGRLIRMAMQGQAWVVADNGGRRDSVLVTLSNITYDSLRIVVNDNGLRDLLRDTLRTDEQTTYYALGRRSDNGEWDNVSVNWRVTGVTTTPAAPAGQVDQFAFQPADTGSLGRIAVSLLSGARTITDSVFVVFQPGLPNHVVLFPATGTPYQGANQPYPAPTVTDTITAGSARHYVAKVFDHNNLWLNQYEVISAPVSWTTAIIAGGAVTDTLSRRTGDSTTFRPFDARKTLYVIAEFNQAGIVLRDSVRVQVTASTATHLVIEASPDPSISPNNDMPLYGVTFTSRDTISIVYAILRDVYGNFIDCSRATDWWSRDTTVVKARGGAANLGEGAILRASATQRSTYVLARNQIDSSLIDSVEVDVNNVSYDSLRIVVNAGGLRDLDTLTMRTDQDTTLYALGRRSDNRQWDNVRLSWAGPGLQIDPIAPQSSDHWTMSPTAPGTGIIRITFVDSTGRQIKDSIVAVFLAGLPQKLVIYPAAGQPGVNNNLPYPPYTTIDTVVAGDSIPLFAKFFDHLNAWLSQYENAAAPVRWSLTELAGSPPTGTLAPRTGNASVFVPRNARNRLYVVAQHESGAYGDTVCFYIKPGAANHIVLEASPDPSISPTADNPVSSITVGTRDTVANVYAILRDRLGNFVGYASDVIWTSLDTSVVRAADGNTNVGEGRIARNRNSQGSTYVVVQDRNNPGFRDTVAVTLATVSYDSLRIVDENSVPVTTTLTRRTDQGQVTFMVQGKRADNGQWELVPANWAITSGLSVSPAAPTSDSTWTFTVNDTGHGAIRVSMDVAVGDTLPVVFLPGLPVRLALYPARGAPSTSNAAYPQPATPITVVAGQVFGVVAKIFDHHDVWLSTYELNGSGISWGIEEIAGNTLGDSLSTRSGDSTSFRPTEARRTVYIIGKFDQSGGALMDTVRVLVLPGPAHHLVLEPVQSWLSSATHDNPIDTVTITNIETYRSVYAIVRDTFGNFVAYSERTQWSTTNADSIVSVEDGASSVGEGRITKTYNGTEPEKHTRVIAVSEQYPGLSDSAEVTVLKIWFTALRIAYAGDTARVGSLTMWTDQDTTLRALGRRSDNGLWMEVQARWELRAGLNVAPDAPERAGTWRFSPVTPDTSGTGWLRITIDVDSISLPDTAKPVVFRRSPPSTILFDIITPPEEIVAGDTITAVVHIRNRDGLVPGTYCDSSLYWDPLTRTDGSRPRDTAMVDGAAGGLSTSSSGSARMGECFSNGVDTVRFVLYYAPSDPDSLNQLWVRIGGAVGSTTPFRVLPAELERMGLEVYDGPTQRWIPRADSLVLHFPTDVALIAAVGYDKYGNRRGKEMSHWTTTGQIPPTTIAIGRQVYYMSEVADDNGRGYIKAETVDTSGGAMRDSLLIRIIGYLPTLLSASTRDSNGNGLLDHVVLHFTRKVVLPATFNPSVSVVLTGNNGLYSFIIDSTWRYGADSTVLVFGIVEKPLTAAQSTNKAMYQTGWQPRLWVAFSEGAASIDSLQCLDSAGPVIVSVTKRMRTAFDRTTDVVRVVFSEPVYANSGALSPNMPPADLFLVWYDDSTAAPGFFCGINSMLTANSDSVVFQMRNGQDLTTRHFLSINVNQDTLRAGSQTVCIARDSVLTDQVDPGRNWPNLNNQHVRVVLETRPAEQAVVWPNPSKPSSRIVDPGEFHLANMPNIRRNGNDLIDNGFVFTFSLMADKSERVNASIAIYDVAGNLVQSASNPNINSTNPGDVSVYTVDVYWNGYNAKGTPAAPGVYRYIIFLQYASDNQKDTKLFGNIGIKR